MATSEELIALFGSDFESVLKGLSQLPPEARELLDNTMGKMLYDTEIFSSRVNKAVGTQSAAGISAAAISSGLASDMFTGGPVFGEIRNTIKSSLVEGINQSGRAGSYEAYEANDKTLFTWVTVAGHKICKDCDPYGGTQQTMSEWESIGMPGTGWSVCGGNCYCILDPSGKISPVVEAERSRAELVSSSKELESYYIKEYKVSSAHQFSYKKFMKLDSSTAMQMQKRVGGKFAPLTRAEIIRRSNQTRKKLSLSKQSFERHTVNGELTRARKKVHNSIINEIVNGGKIAKKGKQELLTTGGYPGSGKSTMLDQAFPGWEKKFVHLDSDRVKELLAKADGVDLGWRAALYHVESKQIVNQIRKLAIEQNRHILYDATMKSTEKFVKAIEGYKSAGYKVTAAFADLPIEQAMERAIARFFGKSGRFVDPLYISTHGNQNIATFNELKRIINSWSQYSTNVPIGAPAILLEQSAVRTVAAKSINKIDDLLGTAKLSSQANNIEKVTGRFGYKQKPPYEVWQELIESTDYKKDLAKYSEFLEKNGLKGIADDLNELWKLQDLDGEALFRYIASELDDSYTHFAHNKYMNHDALLQAAYKKKIGKFMKTYLREKNITLNDVLQAMKYDKQFNQNMLKRYGFVDDAGNVKIYRGVARSYFDETGIPMPKEYGETAQMAVNSAESWSTSATVAEKFASSHGRGIGVVFEAEVPVDRIIGSNFSFAHIKRMEGDFLEVGKMVASELGEMEIIIGGTKPVNVKVFEFGG